MRQKWASFLEGVGCVALLLLAAGLAYAGRLLWVAYRIFSP